MPQKELEQYVAQLKPKKPPQFPPPEYIYTKQFVFLSASLSVLHQRHGANIKCTAQEDNEKKIKAIEEVSSNATNNSGEKTEGKPHTKSFKKVSSYEKDV